MTFGLPQGIAHRSRQMTARAPHTHFIRLDLWNMCFTLFNDQGQANDSGSKIYFTLYGWNELHGKLRNVGEVGFHDIFLSVHLWGALS